MVVRHTAMRSSSPLERSEPGARSPRNRTSRPKAGPALGRPLVDSIAHSLIILFAFDPWRSAILLTGGDKSGDWRGCYRRAIPRAEELYEEYFKEREAREER